MTLTERIQAQELQPRQITVNYAQNRLQDIKDLVAEGSVETREMAQIERATLYLNVLYSIANAPAIADKREFRKLAGIALEAFQIQIETE